MEHLEALRDIALTEAEELIAATREVITRLHDVMRARVMCTFQSYQSLVEELHDPATSPDRLPDVRELLGMLHSFHANVLAMVKVHEGNGHYHETTIYRTAEAAVQSLHEHS